MLEINLKPGNTRMCSKKPNTALRKKVKIFVGVWAGLALFFTLITTFPMAFSYLVLVLCGAGSIWASWHIISGAVDNS